MDVEHKKVMGDLSGAWPGPLDSIFGGACVAAACPARENKEVEKRPGDDRVGGERRRGKVGWVFRAVERRVAEVGFETEDIV